MGYNYYQYFGLIAPGSDASLKGLKDKLYTWYSESDDLFDLKLDGNQLQLSLGDYVFTIHYNDAPTVLAESKEMAETLKGDSDLKTAIASCAARFEMHGDTDEDMDYFNDSLYIQEHWEDFEGVYTFDIVNGELLNA